ncbi:kell blood group glycoprotein [Gouania willdenowi]|uniref:Kell blood group glycoprotein-like n=1 Tax=Gouania willdenowi TaxID=441366 RepID=A0A8C5D777_GOUWI|nr:kell blood group glycoprotein-like [Gouania willdenowi]
MSDTSIELQPQLSVQTLSQPEPLNQLPHPTQENQQVLHQNRSGPQQQTLSESDIDHRHREKPMCIKHQRLLLLLLLGICGAILGLIYIIYHNVYTDSYSRGGSVTPCVSAACQSASARISSSTDPFTQTCDFFLFTCESDSESSGHGGPGYPQNNMESSSKAKRNGENEEKQQREKQTLNRKDVLLQYLREILETDEDMGSSAVQKTRAFYQSCLDTRSLETTGTEPFLTLVQKLGGWAVSGQWNQTDFNSTLSMLMRDYATFPFFNIYVGKDPKETAVGFTQRYIQIDQPNLMIPIEWNSKTRKSKAKTEALRPFLASCQRYLALLGAPPSGIMTHVGLFISLSSELAVSASPLQYRLKNHQLHQRMTIKELQKQAPAIDWLRCLQAVFQPLSLSEDDHVLLHNLPYIVQMSNIINKWLNKHELRSSGPLHTYMVLNLLHTLMPAMDSRFSQTAKNLSLTLRGVPRWRHCVVETEKGFGTVLTHLLKEMIVQKEAEEIIQSVFSSFKSKLHQLKWTNQKTFQLFNEKIHSLTPRLWTSSNISNKVQLDNTFSKVSVTRSFFSNYIQLLSLWQERRSKLLATHTEPPDILSVTPVLLGNELLFPMGMFIPPLYHPTYPRAINFGATGFILAKDIFHLLLPDIYSHSETVSAVGECVWTHYHRVSQRAGRTGPSSLSAVQQQEVWLQYSALQVALQAYQQSLRRCPEDTSVSGLSHTRLFLTWFSQINCDSDPYQDVMPLDPSFLITVLCGITDLCAPSLHCSLETLHASLKTC